MDLTPEQAFYSAGGRVSRAGNLHNESDGYADDIRPAEIPADDDRGSTGQSPQPPKLNFIAPRTLHGVPIAPREWIVEDWLPVGSATLNFGDGGTGKTLLAQQLMTSCATGMPWIGLAVTRCRSLAIFCEDDEAELHRRQDRINSAYGIEFDALDAMTWASGVGNDNALMRFAADGRPLRLPMLDAIHDAARAHAARLIVLDTAADMFGGNENDRAQVRAFMGALNGLAMELRGAVLINAHPSRTGLSATGDMDGGSTAWSNTARSRWSLSRPKAEGDDAPDTDERILTRRKANYSAIGAELRLRWAAGAILPITAQGNLATVAANANADETFLALLAKSDASNRPVNASNQASNFAPKVFAATADRQGFNRRDFEKAMERLFASGKISLVNYGRKGDERRRIALVEGGTLV